MALFTEDLKEILNYYENEADIYKSILKSAPPGKLYLQKNPNGSNQLLYYKNENSIVTRRGVNKDVSIQKALAKKEFASKALDVLEHNNSVLREAIDKQMPFDPDSILRSMTNAYSILPEEYFFDRNALMINMNLDGETQARINSHKEWGLQPYKESFFHPENKTNRTSTGKYVRSKSELLIYETLINYGIPFHYDEERQVNGLLTVMDFTFQDITKDCFYWEHFGMMDSPKYARKNFRKLDNYYDAGIIPGYNLIITFSKGDNINMGTINAVITNEVLPKL